MRRKLMYQHEAALKAQEKGEGPHYYDQSMNTKIDDADVR
jgi:hypothetical protein